MGCWPHRVTINNNVMARIKIDLKDKLDELATLFANLLEDCPQYNHKAEPISEQKTNNYESKDTIPSQRAVGLCLPTPVHYVSSAPSPGKHR